MQRNIKYGFSILLPVEDAIILFGEKLKLSCIVMVSQAHRCARLILNLSYQPDANTLSVNKSTDRESAQELLQFGRGLYHIRQAVWDVDPVQGPVRVSKLDVIYVYHPGTVNLSQVGTFSYVIPLAPGDKGCIICIYMVLTMGWVDSPKFFCAFLETLIDVANALVDTDLPVQSYGAISKIPVTGPGPPHTPDSLIYIDFYMSDVISTVRGGKISNTESLTARYVPSIGSSQHYRGR